VADKNYLEFIIAKSHLGMNARENKILDVFFQLHGFYIQHNKRSKITLAQAAKLSALGAAQLSQGLDDLIMKNIILRVKASEAVTERAGEKLHSIPILESVVDVPVYGALYDVSAELFFCLNYRWDSWLYAKDVPVLAKVKKFTVEKGKAKDGDFQSVGSMAKKALDYFCTKFVAKYRTKYSCNAGSMKEFMKMIELLRDRNADDQSIFSFIDFAYQRRLDMVHPMLIKYVAEDFELFLTQLPRTASGEDGFVRDADGQVRVR